MITTLLNGGLGNQMFQYAAARVLAKKHRTSLRMYSLRAADYHLYPFQVKGKVISDYPPTLLARFCPGTSGGETRLLRGLGFCSKMIRNAKRKMGWPATFNEWQSPASQSFFDAKDRIFLVGLWQKHEYYESIAAELAREFTVKTEPNAANRDLMKRIRASSQAVAVHVRRQDYLQSPHHELCHPDYYRAAFRQLGAVLTAPVFFVFSDDLQWARRHLSPPGETHYVDINGPRQGYEDMRLMRACRHFVIANSTFSWWPAWLADARDKIVYAPKAWHTAEVDERMCLDRHCPEHWRRL